MDAFDAYEKYLERCLEHDTEPIPLMQWLQEWDEDKFDNDRQEN